MQSLAIWRPCEGPGPSRVNPHGIFYLDTSGEGDLCEKSCQHLTEGEAPTPLSDTCDECAKAGDTPALPRICGTCGHVGCCDSTPGNHATAHFEESKQPTMQSFEPGDDWGWRHVDNQGIGPFPAAR